MKNKIAVINYDYNTNKNNIDILKYVIMLFSSFVLTLLLIHPTIGWARSSPKSTNQNEELLVAQLNKQAFRHKKNTGVVLDNKVYNGNYPQLLHSFYSFCSIKPQISYTKKGIKYYIHPTYNRRKCGFISKNKNTARKNNVIYGNIMLGSVFAKQLVCWEIAKDYSCSKYSRKYQQMEGDVYNVVPEIIDVEQERHQYDMGALPVNFPNSFGKDIKINSQKKIFAPALQIRGDIARVYLYMEDYYKSFGVRLTKKQKLLMKKWDKQDPVDQEECLLNELKAEIQGNKNKFVTRYCN